MPLHVQTYRDGMDRDSSVNKYSPSSYYKMKNMRLTDYEELANGRPKSVKGNTLKLGYPSGYGDYFAIGACIIRDYLVVWATDCTNDNPGGVDEALPADGASNGAIFYTDLSEVAPTWTYVYASSEMNLTTVHPIDKHATGYYYDDDSIKVYWTDKFNQLRFIDILNPGVSDVSEIDMLSESDLPEPSIVNILSGNIYAGKIQYAYQLYNEGGVETRYSTCTPLVHLTNKSESLAGSNMRIYQGMDYLDDAGNPQSSGKAVALQFTGVDTNYDKIKIVAIHYYELDAEPTIHVVGVFDTMTNMYVTDYGNYSYGTITFNAFRMLGNDHLIVGSLEQKNNKLLLGNIKQKYFDVDFDARAYRFGPYSTFVTGETVNLNVTNTADIDLVNTTNSKVRLESTTPTEISSNYHSYAFQGLAGGSPLGALYYLSMEYTETGAVGISDRHSDGILLDSDADIVFNAMSDSRVDVVISNFQSWAETNLGIPFGTTITDVTDINELSNTISGEYENITGTTNISYNDSACTISVSHNLGLDQLTITVEKVGIFTNVDHIEHDGLSQLEMTLGIEGFSIDYEYTEIHTYQTAIESELVYDILNDLPADVDEPTIQFDIDIAAGNWFTLTTAFDASKITSIQAYVEIEFSGTAMVPWCRVWDSQTSSYDTIVKTGVWPDATFQIGGSDVPEDHDCINPFNYDFEDGFLDEYATYTPVNDWTIHPVKGGAYLQNANSFKYLDDLSTLGGEGPNVKYEFVTERMTIDESSDSRYVESDQVEIENLTSFDSHQNPLRCAYLANHKRDETYRYGLVLVNTKSEESYVKWIGDIRTPTIKEEQMATLAAPRTMYGYSLGIKFTIDTSSLPSDVKYFKIVRVKREENDRVIYSQGAIANLFEYASQSIYYPFPRATIKKPTHNTHDLTREEDLIQFISPEINYFKDLVPAADDYIKIQAILDSRYSYLKFFDGSPPTEHDVLGVNETAIATYATLIVDNSYVAISKYCGCNTTGLSELPSHTIIDGIISGPVSNDARDENQINLLTAPGPVVNYAFDKGPALANHRGPGGTTLMAILNSNIDSTPIAASADEYLLYLVDYKRPGVAAYQYGGLTYEARLRNTYITASELVEITGAEESVECYRGDTYVSIFEHLNTIFETEDLNDDGDPDVEIDDRICSVLMFPVESHINCWLDHGHRYSRTYELDYSHALRETAGDWDGEYLNYAAWPYSGHQLNQDEDMYQYNRAYSQQDTSKIYLMKQESFESVVHYDTLVKISNEKYVEETLDSYLQFLPDNEKLLPTTHGPITELFLFKNYMIVWFEDAFGTLSIDDRALLPIQNNTLLEMGAANNLQFFDFISTKSGTSHPMSIAVLGEGFCWFDIKNKAFGFYNGQTQDLGLAKGLSSDLNRMSGIIGYYDNVYAGGNITVTENKAYKEVILSFVRTDMLTYVGHSVNGVWLTGAYKPTTNYTNAIVYVNGTRYIAQIGAAYVALLVADNATLNPASFASGGPFYCVYKDLSLSVSFSSIINAFMHEVDFYPTIPVKFDNDLYELFGKFILYKENVGNYGEFYGHYEDAELDYIINPKQSLICVFNNYKYLMKAINALGVDVVDETWDNIRTTNDYQDSGVVTLVPGTNPKRRHRRWSIADVRDSSAITPKARMRDSFLKIELTYVHGSNKHIIMDDLYVYYYVTRESSMNT